MTLVIEILTFAAAAGALVLILVRPWPDPLADLVAIALSGITAVGGALQVGESQIALAWSATLIAALALSLSAGPAAAAAPGRTTGPFRLLGRRAPQAVVSVDASRPVRDWVFRIVVLVVVFGAAAVLAERAFSSGAVGDLALTWAGLVSLGGGMLASVLAGDRSERNAALLLTLNGLALGLILVDRDWGRALAVAVLQVIVAINGAIQTEPATS